MKAPIVNPAKQEEDGYLDRIPWFQFILISVCFPMWGAAASLNDILITQFKSIFTLSDFASAFVQSAFYGGYFLIAIPASRVIKKTSYKVGVMIGLAVYILGCTLFFPASHMATYSVFLVALFALAIGLSFLETSCNTYSTMLGPKKSSTLRLNISQTFYPIGSITGILLGKYLVFTEGGALKQQMAAMAPEERVTFGEQMLQRTLQPYQYLILILVVLLTVVALTEMPACKPLQNLSEQANATIGETLRYLLNNRRFLQGILVQFLYVGMQTAVWSFTIRLALELDHNLNERSASTFMIFSFIAFFIGKFIANILMSKFDPNLVIVGYSVLGLSLIHI